MADTPALAPEYGYYQRLLARDQSEAADLIERHIKTQPPRSVYDALLLPALNYAERDRLEQRLSLEEETAVIDATRELLSDAAESIRSLPPEPPTPPVDPVPDHVNPCTCSVTRSTAWPTSSRSGCSPRSWTTCRSFWKPPIHACRLRARCAGQSARSLRRLPGRPAAQLAVQDALSGQAAPCRTPDVRIPVGRWAPPGLADESTHVLRDAGAILGLDAVGDPNAFGRPGGDPIDERAGGVARAMAAVSLPMEPPFNASSPRCRRPRVAA